MPDSSKINFDDTATAFANRPSHALRRSLFIFWTMNYPLLVKAGTWLIEQALLVRLPVKGLIRHTLFNEFCGGESIRGSEARMIALASGKVKTILDYSVEGASEEATYEATKDELIRVATYARLHTSIPFCVAKLTGLGPVGILAKKQSEQPLSPIEKELFMRMLKRVDTVVSHAVANDVKFLIDAEESWIQETIDHIVLQLMSRYNHKKCYVYNTYQMYKHRALDNLKDHHRQLRTSGVQMGIKLVRGAYMEKERGRAKEQGYVSPIHPTKAHTDTAFNDGMEYAFGHMNSISICLGTHNEASCQRMVDLMTASGVSRNDERIYFAQLLGMSDNISFQLADLGYNVAKYVPYGPVHKVMPYLFRRAEENTSISGQGNRQYDLIKKELTRRHISNDHT